MGSDADQKGKWGQFGTLGGENTANAWVELPESMAMPVQIMEGLVKGRISNMHGVDHGRLSEIGGNGRIES